MNRLVKRGGLNWWGLRDLACGMTVTRIISKFKVECIWIWCYWTSHTPLFSKELCTHLHWVYMKMVPTFGCIWYSLSGVIKSLALIKCKFSAFKYSGLDNDGFGRLTLLCFQKNFAHIFIGYIWWCYQRLVVFDIVYQELSSRWHL